MDSFQACKHIWAAILAADRAQAFRVPATVWLDLDDGFDDFDDGLGDPDPEYDPDRDVGEDEDLFEPSSERYPANRRLSNAQRQTIAEGMKRLWSERRAGAGRSQPAPVPPPPPRWQTLLSHVTTEAPAEGAPLLPGELIYVFDPSRSAAVGGLHIELLRRERKKSGDWGKPKTVMIARRDIARLPDERDRRILDVVCGADGYAYSSYQFGSYGSGLPVPSSFVLNLTLQRELVPRLCATGRMLLRVASPANPGVEPHLIPIQWTADPARYVLRISGDASRRLHGRRFRRVPGSGIEPR